MERICDKRVIDTLVKAEPIGPKKLLDVLVICPCTGNTLAKLANGVTDTSVTMAAKAHLRNGRPLVILPRHQRRPGRLGPKHRNAAGQKARLLRPLPPG